MTQRRHEVGQVFWLCGLSGAGKSTLAEGFHDRLWQHGHAAVILDGDQVRTGISADLDYSEPARWENTRRVAEMAALIASPRVTVITALISPLERLRVLAREIVAKRRPAVALTGVFVSASVATCASRDVKGLYARALTGDLRDFTGISAAFEPPASPDVLVDTEQTSVAAGVDVLFDEWERRRFALASPVEP